MSLQVKLNIALVVITIVALVFGIKNAERLTMAKNDPRKILAKRQKIHNRYVLYNNNILTRARFRHILQAYSSMMCYDFDTIKEQSVKLFEKSVGVAITFPLAILVATQNYMLGILALFIGYIYYNMSVDGAIDKQEVEINNELSYTIQSIHDGYSLTDNVPVAVINADRGKFLERPITTIYEILTDIHGEEMLYQFKSTVPVRLLGTLATICYINNNEGDTRDKDGESAFSKEMITLRQEADAKVRRLKKRSIAFKSLSGLALLGIITMPAIDWYLLKYMPGTALYIKGMYGAFTKVLIITSTILAYYVISVLSRHSVVNQVDKIEWINNLYLDNPKIKEFVNKLIPKKYKTRLKIIELLNDSLSSKNFEYIYTLKCVASVFLASLIALCLFMFTITARIDLKNNYGSLSMGSASSQSMTERMYRQIVELDKEYMSQKVQLSREDAEALTKSTVVGIKDLEIKEQVDRLETKWKYYHSLVFHWYYVLIVYGAGVIGWFTPEFSLLLRKKLVQFEATEDVMQLQTMMITLSNTKMDVYRALYWLTAESTIHKSVLRYAFLEYPSDPLGSLELLKDKVPSRDMKRLVSKLHKAVYDLSLSEAFSDIILDKQQSIALNEMEQDQELVSKKEWARMFAVVPFYGTIFLEFIGTIALLGISQLMSGLAGL